MLSGQIDVGFLTASGYAEVTLKHPGQIEVSMTSVRKGYQVQIDLVFSLHEEWLGSGGSFLKLF